MIKRERVLSAFRILDTDKPPVHQLKQAEPKNTHSAADFFLELRGNQLVFI
jgi:hypothetical protein